MSPSYREYNQPASLSLSTQQKELQTTMTIVKGKGPINISCLLEAIQQNHAHQLPSMDFILF